MVFGPQRVAATSVISTGSGPCRAWWSKPYSYAIAGIDQSLDTKPAIVGKDVVVRAIFDLDADRLDLTTKFVL